MIWRNEAKRLYAQGLTYAQIGAHVGRTRQRVEQVINDRPHSRCSGPRHDDTPETKRRRLLRRWCRKHAQHFGKSVPEMYAKYGVEDL